MTKTVFRIGEKQKHEPVNEDTLYSTWVYLSLSRAQLRVTLTFMGPCIVNIFQYIFNKMQLYTVYLYLETALHVSGGTSTHHHERIQMYLQHLIFVRPLLLPAASGR